MKLYFIKHTPTGYYLPEPVGRASSGGSHTEPDSNSDNARIFRSERAAEKALRAWLRGKHVAKRETYSDGPDFTEEGYGDIEIIPVPSRKRKEMEIVEVEISL